MRHPPLATLRFFSDELQPDMITSIVEVQPTTSALKGAPLFKSRGRKANARVGTWFITTKSKDLGLRPDMHLAWVVQLARDHIQAIRRQDPDIKANFSLLVHDPRFTLSDLPRDLLQHAVEIGPLDIELVREGEQIPLDHQNLAGHLATLTA